MMLLMMMRQWWEIGGKELGKDGVKIYSELMEIPFEQINTISNIIDM